MGLRQTFTVVSFVAVHLLPVAGEAGHHNFGVYAAGSGTDNGGSNSGSMSTWNGGLSRRSAGSFGDGWGWHVSGEATLKAPDEQKYRWGFVADISAHFVGEGRKRDATQITGMIGPRFSYQPVFSKRANFFAHVMVFGAIHRSHAPLSTSVSTQAFAVGAGVDVTRASEGHLGIRFQVDRIIAGTGVENTTRYSLGLVYLFHDEEDGPPRRR